MATTNGISSRQSKHFANDKLCYNILQSNERSGRTVDCKIALPEIPTSPRRNKDKFKSGDDDTKHPWSDAEKRNLAETAASRILFFGSYQVGKTSLVRSILSQSPYVSEQDDRTVIVELRNWVPPKRRETYTLVDLGGHPAYQICGHFFHANSPNNIATLCHDISSDQSDQYERSFDWMKSVLTRSPTCQFIPVLTKVDKVDEKERIKLFDKFINVLNIYLEEEIRYLTKTIMYAEKLKSPKQGKFNDLKDKYISLKENLRGTTIETSCQLFYGIDKYVNQITKLTDEHKISIPVLCQKFYIILGKRGVSFSSKKATKHFSTKNGKKWDENGHNLQYITFDEAVIIYHDIHQNDESLTPDDINLGVKSYLTCLHKHGLLLYFQGNPELEKIIFNDINSFVNVLKSVFNHNVDEFLSREDEGSMKLLVQHFDNNQKSFNNAVEVLQKQGLLSIKLLSYLLKRGQCNIESVIVMELLSKLEVGFCFTPESSTSRHIFVPFFIESKKFPSQFIKSIEQIRCCDEDNLSMQCHIMGNIPVTFWHYLLVSLFKRLYKENDLQGRVVWDKGFWATLGRKNFKLLLTYNGKNQIDFVCKGNIKDVEGHTLIWDYIKYISNETERLTTEWWPGLVTSKILECTHCNILKQNGISPPVDCYEFPNQKCLDKLLMDVENGIMGDTETYYCDNDSEEDIPAALLLPLPTVNSESDNSSQQAMVEALQGYLKYKLTIISSPDREMKQSREAQTETDLILDTDIMTEEPIKEKTSSVVYSHEELQTIYKEMRTTMEELTIPPCIYMYRIGRRKPRIFFDVAKDSTKEAKLFLYKTFPLAREIIHITEQEPPRYPMLHNSKSKYSAKTDTIDSIASPIKIPNSGLPTIRSSSRMIKVHPDEIEDVLKDAETTCIDDLIFSNKYRVGKYGSLGGFMQDKKSNHIYAITANHFLKTEKKGEQTDYSTGKLEMVDVYQPEVGIFKDDKFPVISEFKGGNTMIEHIGDVYRGGLYYCIGQDAENKAVDVAAVKIRKESFSSEKYSLLYKTQHGDSISLQTYSGSDEHLLDKEVQKYGFTSLTTHGIITGVDENVNIGDHSARGTFRVEHLANNGTSFCQKGDSGSLVISPVQNSQAWVYGICFQVYDKYVDEDNEEESIPKSISSCVRISHCLDFLKEMFGLDLQWCKTLGVL